MGTATNKRKRRAEISRIKRAIGAEIHKLSTVITDDKLAGHNDPDLQGALAFLTDGVTLLREALDQKQDGLVTMPPIGTRDEPA